MPATLEDLEAAIAPFVIALGAEVVDVELRASSLQVVIDRPEGLDLETLAATARQISDLLDANDDLAPEGHYELEVTSPGLERRLRRPDHFAKAIGSSAAIRTNAGATDRRIEGVILAADETGVVISTANAGERRVDYRDIDRAHTTFDWKAELARAKRAKVDDESPTSSARATRAREKTTRTKEHGR